MIYSTTMVTATKKKWYPGCLAHAVNGMFYSVVVNQRQPQCTYNVLQRRCQPRSSITCIFYGGGRRPPPHVEDNCFKSIPRLASISYRLEFAPAIRISRRSCTILVIATTARHGGWSLARVTAAVLLDMSNKWVLSNYAGAY